MGNSQSLDKVQHVVKEGINIYNQVKKQQEQQQEQQPHYNNDNQQHGGLANHYHASPNEGDDDHYSQLRAQAHDEAQLRNDCYARSQEAYRNGDGGEGTMEG
jgi:hypothetical protein